MRAVATIGFALIGLTACGRAPKATRYILDNGITGWVKINYNRSDAPELPVENGFAVVRVPGSMILDTSNKMISSWDQAEFYYRTPDGKLKPISSVDGEQRQLWGMEKITDREGNREVFFVGRQDQFTKRSNVQGDMGANILGQPGEIPAPPASPDRSHVATSPFK